MAAPKIETDLAIGTEPTEHGYRKLASGVGIGMPVATVLGGLWTMIDRATPSIDLSPPPEMLPAIGVLIAAGFFYRTKEQDR